MRHVAAAATVALALAAPAAADGHSYFNGDSAHGAYVITSGRTIQQLELYCSGGGTTETSFSNDFDFSVRDVISLGRKGGFRYSGNAYRYGNEHQARGEFKVNLSGRVTSRTVRVNWTLPGCSSGT